MRTARNARNPRQFRIITNGEWFRIQARNVHFVFGVAFFGPWDEVSERFDYDSLAAAQAGSRRLSSEEFSRCRRWSVVESDAEPEGLVTR